MSRKPCYTIVESPVGPLLLARDGEGLFALRFVNGRRQAVADAAWVRNDDAFSVERRELREYFSGRRGDFTFPLVPRGSAFQRRVWRELTRIPYGETISYAELAGRIGNTRAVRAVGLANGANPLAIVVPCHRVIGADGSLTGYGGGIPTKRYLLDLERRTVGRAEQVELFSA